MQQVIQDFINLSIMICNLLIHNHKLHNFTKMNSINIILILLVLEQIGHHLLLQLVIILWIVVNHSYLLMEVFSVVVVLDPVVFAFIDWFFYIVNVLFQTSEFHVAVALREDFFKLFPVLFDDVVPCAYFISSYNETASSIKVHFEHSENSSDWFSDAKNVPFINFKSDFI